METKMNTLIDLEQELLNFSNITIDMNIIDNKEDVQAIQRIYNKKFDKLYELFEEHCKEVRKLRNKSPY